MFWAAVVCLRDNSVHVAAHHDAAKDVERALRGGSAVPIDLVEQLRASLSVVAETSDCADTSGVCASVLSLLPKGRKRPRRGDLEPARGDTSCRLWARATSLRNLRKHASVGSKLAAAKAAR